MDRILLTLKLVGRSLLADKLRSGLTLSAVAVGVAAVAIVSSVGRAAEEEIVSQLESYGTDTINVEIKVPSNEHISTGNFSGIAMGVRITTLTTDDAAAIARLPAVEYLAAGLMDQQTISVAGRNKTAVLMGIGEQIVKVDRQTELAAGRFFDSAENAAAAAVVILGSSVAEELFPDRSPIGRKVKIKGRPYKVIGVLAPRGMMFGFSYDELVYLPLETLRKKILGVDYVQFILLSAREGASTEKLAEDIRALLRLRHGTSGNDDDFGVTTMKEVKDMLSGVLSGLTILLTALSAVALTVGGVGIMNVMLSAVAERRAEIGVRKALGATEGDILRQFFIEATAISLLGGVFGIVLAAVFLSLLGYFAQDFLSLSLSFGATAWGLVASFSIGAIFGYFPAREASRTLPAQAMGEKDML